MEQVGIFKIPTRARSQRAASNARWEWRSIGNDARSAFPMLSNKKLTLHQKKEIIQLHLANPKLGYTKLAKMIPEKFGFTLSRTSLRLILKNKEQLLDTVTSDWTTRTTFLTESMNKFRAKLDDKIKKDGLSYEQIKILCQKLKEDPEFKEDVTIQKLSFSKPWIAAFKKDYQISKPKNWKIIC